MMIFGWLKLTRLVMWSGIKLMEEQIGSIVIRWLLRLMVDMP